jgi:VanZ family protein
MIAIFIASSQINLPSVRIGVWDFAIKKSGHVFEYAVLGLLLFRACYGSAAGLASLRPAAAALVIGGLYAASDEFHQVFVPTRNGTARDVLIDLAAIILALALAWVWRRRWRPQRQP